MFSPSRLLTWRIPVSRRTALFLKLGLTAGVLVALGLSVSPVEVLGAVREARWAWVLLAALLLPLNLFLDGWVWGRLLEPVTGPLSVRRLAGAVLCGMTLGAWTPAQLGEYAGRTFSLGQGDRWTVSLTVLVQRMVDMAVAVDAGLAALLWALVTGRLPTSTPWIAAASIGILVGGALTVLVAAPSGADRLTRWVLPRWPAVTRRTNVLRTLPTKLVLLVAGGSLLRYLVFTTQFVCLALAFRATASPPVLFAITALIFYVKYLIPSLTVLDLGIREGAAVGFFHLFGLATAPALNAALLLFVLNRLVPALLGLPFLLHLRLPHLGSKSPETKEAASILTG